MTFRIRTLNSISQAGLSRLGADAFDVGPDVADPHAILEAARIAGVHELIGRLPLGYDTSVADIDFKLPCGPRQRIGLARALYGDTALEALDDPCVLYTYDVDDDLQSEVPRDRRDATTQRHHQCDRSPT